MRCAKALFVVQYRQKEAAMLVQVPEWGTYKVKVRKGIRFPLCLVVSKSVYLLISRAELDGELYRVMEFDSFTHPLTSKQALFETLVGGHENVAIARPAWRLV